MSSLAAGAFLQGIVGGINTRHSWDDRKRNQRLQDEDRSFLARQRQFQMERDQQQLEWDKEDRRIAAEARKRTNKTAVDAEEEKRRIAKAWAAAQAPVDPVLPSDPSTSPRSQVPSRSMQSAQPGQTPASESAGPAISDRPTPTLPPLPQRRMAPPAQPLASAVGDPSLAGSEGNDRLQSRAQDDQLALSRGLAPEPMPAPTVPSTPDAPPQLGRVFPFAPDRPGQQRSRLPLPEKVSLPDQDLDALQRLQAARVVPAPRVMAGDPSAPGRPVPVNDTGMAGAKLQADSASADMEWAAARRVEPVGGVSPGYGSPTADPAVQRGGAQRVPPPPTRNEMRPPSVAPQSAPVEAMASAPQIAQLSAVNPMASSRSIAVSRHSDKTPGEAFASGDPQAAQAKTAEATSAAASAPSVAVTAEPVQRAARSMDVRTASPAQIQKTGDRVAKSAWDRFMETGVPAIVDGYMQNGDVNKAKEFMQFVDAENTREAIGHWTKMQFSAAIGDEAGFLKNAAAAYNSAGYYDDGYELIPEDSGMTRDEGGDVVGARLSFRNLDTGEVFTQKMDGPADFFAMGIGLLAPETVFENYSQQVATIQAAEAAAQKVALESGIKLREDTWSRFSEAYKLAQEQSGGALGGVSDPQAVTDSALQILQSYEALVGGGRSPSAAPIISSRP